MISSRAMLIVSLTILSSAYCLYGIENSVVTIENVQRFDQFLKNTSRPVVAQFHSGCPVCQATGKHFRKAASEYTTMDFLEININSMQELAQRYNIAALPTVLIFTPESQKVEYTIVGPDQKSLETALALVNKNKKNNTA